MVSKGSKEWMSPRGRAGTPDGPDGVLDDHFKQLRNICVAARYASCTPKRADAKARADFAEEQAACLEEYVSIMRRTLREVDSASSPSAPSRNQTPEPNAQGSNPDQENSLSGSCALQKESCNSFHDSLPAAKPSHHRVVPPNQTTSLHVELAAAKEKLKQLHLELDRDSQSIPSQTSRGKLSAPAGQGYRCASPRVQVPANGFVAWQGPPLRSSFGSRRPSSPRRLSPGPSVRRPCLTVQVQSQPTLVRCPGATTSRQRSPSPVQHPSLRQRSPSPVQHPSLRQRSPSPVQHPSLPAPLAPASPRTIVVHGYQTPVPMPVPCAAGQVCVETHGVSAGVQDAAELRSPCSSAVHLTSPLAARPGPVLAVRAASLRQASPVSFSAPSLKARVCKQSRGCMTPEPASSTPGQPSQRLTHVQSFKQNVSVSGHTKKIVTRYAWRDPSERSKSTMQRVNTGLRYNLDEEEGTNLDEEEGTDADAATTRKETMPKAGILKEARKSNP